ncbi:MAG: YodC family protein [Hyphomonas sp.]
MTREDGLEVGALVKLRSGGPAMTVHSIDSDEVVCHWFVKDELKQKAFKAIQLQGLEVEEMSDQELARRISFILEKGKVAEGDI